MATGVDDILNDLISRVGRVRRWLLALSVLRIAALGLACVSLYVGAYAWLDHRVHFGTLGRASSLVLFIALVTVGAYCIVRTLGRNLTYANAANYIEGKRSFDQQLVAAVEYYEGRGDYPYSKALAAQLVRQVDVAAQGCRFDSTIDKWQGYVLAGFVLLCACVAGLFVRQNVLYLSSYLARLFQPFSAVEPVLATVLAPAADDIVAGVDAPVTFDVGIQGRVPESVSLVVTRQDPNDVNAPSPADEERIALAPKVDSQGRTRFTAMKSFDATGRFRYRFETSDQRSDSHEIRVCELPAIDRVTAKVYPPAAPQEDQGQDAKGTSAGQAQPYEVELTDEPLAVLPHSRVELTAQSSMPLREATVVGPDGRSATQSLDGKNRFGFEFTAEAPSSLSLTGVSTDGLAAGESKELRVVLKSDGRPEFKLVSPEGDYLATDVASIPIAFEVTDDFGLESAELFCELPGRDPVILESVPTQGVRRVSLAHVLELEQCDLHVGDSILFYAKARDLAAGRRPADANACSEVYLIEIRPYRQYWHRDENGNQSQSNPGPIAEDLIAILEYTRAIVKKTWTLARSPGGAAEDGPKLEALAQDVQHCIASLTSIRDDPDAGFNDGDKAVMNKILESYELAKRHLESREAAAALSPAQEAYRILRMFIDELHLKWTPPLTGPSSPQETPEKVKLQEQPQEPAMEKERVESRLQEMQREIDSLSQRQESLKADLAKAMRQEKESAAQSKAEDKAGAQQNAGVNSESRSGQEQSASAGQGQPGAGKGQEGEQASSGTGSSADSAGSDSEHARQSAAGQEAQSGEGQGRQGNRQGQSGDGQSGPSGGQQKEAGTPSSSADRESSGSGDSQSSGSKPSDGTAASRSGRSGQNAESDGRSSEGSAQADARMRMLQARQKALREQTSQMSEGLGELPLSEDSPQGRAGREAKGHLDDAVEAMEQFEQRLADARYESGDSSQAGNMADLADSAAQRLAEAGRAIRQGLANGENDSSAKAQEMAEQLAKDAEAYDESLSQTQQRELQDRLKAAERLLESMAGTQWTSVSGGGAAGAGHVYTNDPHASPGETARLLARQFWSMALAGKERRSRPVEQEPSDVEFFEAETRFFEDAAKFGSQDVDK